MKKIILSFLTITTMFFMTNAALACGPDCKCGCNEGKPCTCATKTIDKTPCGCKKGEDCKCDKCDCKETAAAKNCDCNKENCQCEKGKCDCNKADCTCAKANCDCKKENCTCNKPKCDCDCDACKNGDCKKCDCEDCKKGNHKNCDCDAQKAAQSTPTTEVTQAKESTTGCDCDACKVQSAKKSKFGFTKK